MEMQPMAPAAATSRLQGFLLLPSSLLHLPGVPDWEAAIAVLRVGTMSRTLRTEAQNLQSGLNRDI